MVIKYRWTSNVDENGYEAEVQEEKFGVGYTFADFLRDKDVDFEDFGDEFFVVDENGDRTGEAYWIVDEIPSDIEVMMATGSTESEATKHIKNGSTVVAIEDAPSYIEQFEDVFEPEDFEELKKFVEAGKDGRWNDTEIVTVKGHQYFVEYVL